MTELDTSAYTPAHEVENNEETEEEEGEPVRTRFQVDLDQWQKPAVEKALNQLQQHTKENTEVKEKLDEIQNLFNEYDHRKYLNVYIYECRKCEQVFDTKQGAGVHRATNPNCDRTKPWEMEYESLEQQFDKQTVEEYYGEN